MFPPKEEVWLRDIRKLSSYARRKGKLLETQENLLRVVYEKLFGSSKPILTFSAPPASGKTHVIALLAVHFSKLGKQTCIVVPNGELTIDFEKEKSNLISPVKNFVILTLSAYVRRSRDFQIALIDECHNLRSAVELDPARVKTFSFRNGERKESSLFGRLISNPKFVAKALGGEDLRDTLTEVSKVEEYSSTAKAVLNRRTTVRAVSV